MKLKALAAAVCHVFENKDRAAVMGQNAGKRARQTHDGEANYERLMEIYNQI